MISNWMLWWSWSGPKFESQGLSQFLSQFWWQLCLKCAVEAIGGGYLALSLGGSDPRSVSMFESQKLSQFPSQIWSQLSLRCAGEAIGGGVLGTIPGCSSVYYSFFFREFTWHNRFRSVTSKVFVMWTMHYLHLILKKQMKLACFTRICIWLLLEFSLCQTHASTNPPAPGS